ncbi:hypothetical protein HDU98_002673 [Podochytrium sp. JEL0797]|nr:hypothetical protein HDU98_002673 [Podochytrium sp. JEL0797]
MSSQTPELGLVITRISSKSTVETSWCHWKCVTPDIIARIQHEENLSGFAFQSPVVQFRIRRALLRGDVHESVCPSAAIPPPRLGTTKTVSILNHYTLIRKPRHATRQLDDDSMIELPSATRHSRSPSPTPSELSDFEAPFTLDFLAQAPLCPTAQRTLNAFKKEAEMTMALDLGSGSEDDAALASKRKRGRPKGSRTKVKDREVWVPVIEEEEKKRCREKDVSVVILTEGRALRGGKRLDSGISSGEPLSPVKKRGGGNISRRKSGSDSEDEKSEEDVAVKPRRSRMASAPKLAARVLPKPRAAAKPSSQSPLFPLSDEDAMHGTSIESDNRISRIGSGTVQDPIYISSGSDVDSASSGEETQPHHHLTPKGTRHRFPAAQIPLPTPQANFEPKARIRLPTATPCPLFDPRPTPMLSRQPIPYATPYEKYPVQPYQIPPQPTPHAYDAHYNMYSEPPYSYEQAQTNYTHPSHGPPPPSPYSPFKSPPLPHSYQNASFPPRAVYSCEPVPLPPPHAEYYDTAGNFSNWNPPPTREDSSLSYVSREGVGQEEDDEEDYIFSSDEV